MDVTALTLHNHPHHLVPIDHECRPLHGHQLLKTTAMGRVGTPALELAESASPGEPTPAAHPELFGHRTVCVGQQRKIEGSLQGEVLIAVPRVCADTDPLGTESVEFCTQISKMTRFGRANRTVRRRIEEENNRARGRQVGERSDFTGMIR